MKTMFAASLIGAALIATAAPAVTVTAAYEAAGVQQTSRALAGKEVATFDTMSGWVGSGNIFTGPISGTIANGGFNIGGANVYGGAGGTGNFATVYNTTTIKLSQAVNYAGLWASAIDGDFANSQGNTVALYSGDTLLGSFALMPLLTHVSNAYYGNPNANFSGMDSGEPYAFFNFDSTTKFDRIDITQNGGGGFELDNITIGNIGAVPEPASWALMILGFGAIGALLRSSRRRPTVQA
ncbi:PEPxxWA-CTERM sorting domain-containing protein [Sphingomonas sp. MMS24-J13]|uniref:Npun_F0296 family exosortase-dependent surface protein n=1 Tax=Sphingomonas sp. MMS24-J13 TaxID=3238686 RepID=UPI00384ABE6E